MTAKHRIAFLFPACLAGCGGSGISVSDLPDPPDISIPTPQLSTRQTAQLDLLDDELTTSFNSARQLAAADPGTDIPRSGTASYSGHLSILLPSDYKIYGELQMVMDLSENQISGAVSEMLDSAAYPVQGQLAISDGEIDFDGDPDLDFTYSANLSGALTGQTGELRVNASLSGALVGGADPISATYGVVDGSVDLPSGTEPIVAGIFGAERD